MVVVLRAGKSNDFHKNTICIDKFLDHVTTPSLCTASVILISDVPSMLARKPKTDLKATNLGLRLGEEGKSRGKALFPG